MTTTARVVTPAGALLALSIAAAAPSGAQDPTAPAHRFVTHTIAAEFTSGYQPTVVDLNRDGRLDVIGLSTRLAELAWFENPGWQRHVITADLTRAINLAARDLDDDGIPELVVAYAFGTTHENSPGILSLLTHEGDPTRPWRLRELDRTPTVHRLRWADIDGTGRPVLISAPLSGAAATAPDYRDAVPLYWYRPDDWIRRDLATTGQGVVHGLLVKPWDDPNRDAVVTASFAGVQIHRYTDGEWIPDLITAGDPAPWPESGASDVDTGRVGDRSFITTIEPWHGHQVVVYREEGGAWTRQVIDTIGSGHMIVTADFDRDGRDEIVTGDYGDGETLYLYTSTDPAGATWSRQTLDTNMAPMGCVVADLDADTDTDLVCAGSRTANLTWYENVSP